MKKNILAFLVFAFTIAITTDTAAQTAKADDLSKQSELILDYYKKSIPDLTAQQEAVILTANKKMLQELSAILPLVETDRELYKEKRKAIMKDLENAVKSTLNTKQLELANAPKSRSSK